MISLYRSLPTSNFVFVVVFASYVTQSQEVFWGVHFLMKRDLQGRVSGQVTPGTEPEMPVLSFHGLLSWHLGNTARQSAANGGSGRYADVSRAAHLAGHMHGPSTCFPWSTVC